MGTRGSWGFIVDGKRWETYNHFDSYPSCLGNDMLRWARTVTDWDQVAERVRTLTVVREVDPCPPDVLAALTKAEIANPGVSRGTDWYAAMRNAQGDPAMTLDSRYWLDGTDFHKDALFCEWSYVFDLTAREFVIYESKAYGKKYRQVVTARYALDALPAEDLTD